MGAALPFGQRTKLPGGLELSAIGTPDVSVIIPVYQRGEMLVEAVQSVVASSVGYSTEIIVVDDGSSVDMGQFVRHLPVRFHRLERNSGSSGARNVGIGLARGRYLKFLDSDDLLAPKAMAAEVAAADRTGADIVVAGWREIDLAADGSVSVGREFVAPRFNVIEDDLLEGKGVPTSSALYRAMVVTDVRWDLALSKLNDWDYFVSAALASKKIESISSIAYDWRSHPGERITSSSSVARHIQEFYSILGKLIKTLDERSEMTPVRMRRAAQYLYKELRRLWVLDPIEAQRVLDRIMELDPRFVPVIEERTRVFTLAGHLGLLQPTLALYAATKRKLSR